MVGGTQGIAGHVALTGQLLNIQDAYAHPLFYADVDRSTGFQTRSASPVPNSSLSLIIFYRVLSSFTEFYRVLPTWTGFQRLPPTFAQFHRV